MDRRTIYLGELGQVRDLLETQRNAIRAFGAIAYAMFGRTTIAVTLDPSSGPTKKPDPGTNLRVVVPAISIYELAAIDSAWSTLGSDSVQLPIQGINFAATTLPLNATPDSALSIGGGNSVYFLVQGKLNYPVDETNVVVPYYPIISMTTVAGSTASVLKVGSNVGVATGDRIVVAGIATTTGAPAVVLSVAGSDTINLDTGVNQLVSAPGTGITVRDITPNNGVPLSGVNNNGVAQSIDRSARVTFGTTAKIGTPASSPAIPSPDSGFIALFTVLLANGATTVSSGNIAVAPTAPLFNSILQAHHGGTAGQAPKVDIETELTSKPVKRAGDTMTGALQTPHLRLSNGTNDVDAPITAGQIVGPNATATLTMVVPATVVLSSTVGCAVIAKCSNLLLSMASGASGEVKFEWLRNGSGGASLTERLALSFTGSGGVTIPIRPMDIHEIALTGTVTYTLRITVPLGMTITVPGVGFAAISVREVP